MLDRTQFARSRVDPVSLSTVAWAGGRRLLRSATCLLVAPDLLYYLREIHTLIPGWPLLSPGTAVDVLESTQVFMSAMAILPPNQFFARPPIVEGVVNLFQVLVNHDCHPKAHPVGELDLLAGNPQAGKLV